MKKGEIISVIKQQLGGGIPDRTLNIKGDDRVICRYIDMANKDIIAQEMAESDVSDKFIKTFYPYLLWDEQGEYAYIPIPASLMNLPDNRGLRYVSEIDDDTTWDIVKNDAWQVYKEMESVQASRQQVVYIEGNRIICPMVKKSNANTCVKIKIIPMSDGYANNEELPLPVREGAFIERVIQLMQDLKLTPSKANNDGIPDSK